MREDSESGAFAVERWFVRCPEATFLVEAAGCAMSGAGIRDGDLLIVDRSVPVAAGQLVLACRKGAFVVRRLGLGAPGGRTFFREGPEGPEPDFEESERGVSIEGAGYCVVRKSSVSGLVIEARSGVRLPA